MLGIKQDEFLAKLSGLLGGLKEGAAGPSEQVLKIISSDPACDREIVISDPPHPLAVGTCDILLGKMGLTNVDYIHGEDSLRELSVNNTGIMLPPISKDTFFETVARDGVFPRKTFSMGEAFEKRFYLEARKIR